MKKKLLVVALLTVATCAIPFGLVGCSNKDNNADDGTETLTPTAGLEYTLNSDGESYSCISLGTATANEIIIASEYNNKPVAHIGNGAFSGCSRLKSVTVPDSVISIGAQAFLNCNGLEKLKVASGNIKYDSANNSIDTKAETFAVSYENNVKSTEENVTGIGEEAFKDCSKLTNLDIPKNVTSIGNSAFSGCKELTSVTIPDNVISIGEQVFYNCIVLESLNVSSGNVKFNSAGNCLIDTENKTLIAGCKSSVIPTDGSVTSIGEQAFIGCDWLTSITIPDSVTNIGKQAFSWCSELTNVSLGNGVTSIGDEAFSQCTELTNIDIPNSVTHIGKRTFEACGELTSITIPDKVTDIGSLAFFSCSGLTIYCEAASQPSGWENGWNMRWLISYDTPDKFYPVVWDCKNNDKDKDGYSYSVIDGIRYSLKDNVATVLPQPNTFNSNLIIPATVTYKNEIYNVTGIAARAFSNRYGLKSIIIPDSITSIGEYAFSGCDGLISVTIPDSVTSIGDWAFGWEGLTIYCEAVSKPSDWANNWKGSYTPVVWDCKNNDKDENGYAYTVIDGINYSIKDNIATVARQLIKLSGKVTISPTIIYKDETYNVTGISEQAFDFCFDMTSIDFTGTKAQWIAIEKGEDWNSSTIDFTVVCTDGKLDKDGNEIEQVNEIKKGLK